MSGTDLVQSLVRMVRTSLICLVIIDLSLVDSLMSNQHVINGDTTVTCLQLPGLAVTEDVNTASEYIRYKLKCGDTGVTLVYQHQTIY